MSVWCLPRLVPMLICHGLVLTRHLMLTTRSTTDRVTPALRAQTAGSCTGPSSCLW